MRKQLCKEHSLELKNHNLRQDVSNKSKRGISKRWLQENKALQIFQKNEHFLPPDTLMYLCISARYSLLFGKFVVHCFLVTTGFRFALLHYYNEEIFSIFLLTRRKAFIMRKHFWKPHNSDI